MQELRQGNTEKDKQIQQRSTRIKQFIKYANILWITALASGTLYRFTEKHSIINALASLVAITALIAGTSFGFGAAFMKLSPHDNNQNP